MRRKQFTKMTMTALIELSRYIVLNPVRARMVREAKEWPWSSYRATAGMSTTHVCLTTDWLLATFNNKRFKESNFSWFIRVC